MNFESEFVSKLIRPLSELEGTQFTPRQVILAAIEWPNENWLEEALLWIEQGVPLDEEIAKALESVSTRKTHSQHLRHKAFALAKRWRRKNT